MQLIILGQVESEAPTEEQAAFDAEMEVMWTRNLTAGALHMFNFVVGFYLSQTVENMQIFKFELTTLFLDWDNVTEIPTQNLTVQYDFPFVFYCTLFALMSAMGHAACLFWWDKYTSDLALGKNRFRWWEYAVSSSLMICLISMLFGVYDIFSLVFIACINAAMNLFGDLHEIINAGKAPEEVDWTAFKYGGIAGTYSWIIIAVFLFGSNGISDAPTFVWVILVTYFILFFTFPLTMYQQYMQLG